MGRVRETSALSVEALASISSCWGRQVRGRFCVLRFGICRFQISDFKLQISDFRFQISNNFNFNKIVDLKLQWVFDRWNLPFEICNLRFGSLGFGSLGFGSLGFDSLDLAVWIWQ